MARNRGIAASRGVFSVFLDADDHLLPNALDAQLRAFERHPECGFVVGRREEMTYEGAPVPWGIAASPSTTQLYAILLGFDWYIIPPSSAMFRRAVLDRVGGFRDPWGADDLDFYLRVARSHEGFCHHHVVTRYRRYRASSSRDGQRMLASIRAVYAREWPHVTGDPIARGAFDRGARPAHSDLSRLRRGESPRSIAVRRLPARIANRMVPGERGSGALRARGERAARGRARCRDTSVARRRS